MGEVDFAPWSVVIGRAQLFLVRGMNIPTACGEQSSRVAVLGSRTLSGRHVGFLLGQYGDVWPVSEAPVAGTSLLWHATGLPERICPVLSVIVVGLVCKPQDRRHFQSRAVPTGHLEPRAAAPCYASGATRTAVKYPLRLFENQMSSLSGGAAERDRQFHFCLLTTAENKLGTGLSPTIAVDPHWTGSFVGDSGGLRTLDVEILLEAMTQHHSPGGGAG